LLLKVKKVNLLIAFLVNLCRPNAPSKLDLKNNQSDAVCHHRLFQQDFLHAFELFYGETTES